MPITKQITAPNGAPVAFHRARRGEVDFIRGVATVLVASWASEEAHNAGQGLVWMWDPIRVQITDMDDIDAALKNVPPFVGAAVVPDASASLDTLKARRWSAIREKWSQLEVLGFPYLGTTFDSSERSVLRMLVAGQAARAAKDAGEPYEEAWKTADNSIVLLDADQMIGMTVALAQHGKQLFQTAQSLLGQINAATTASEVEAVQWPI